MSNSEQAQGETPQPEAFENSRAWAELCLEESKIYEIFVDSGKSMRDRCFVWLPSPRHRR